ncbi:hypothetical protein V6Z11_A07G135200 [Gossypium hirsutum]
MLNCVRKEDIDYSPYDESKWSSQKSWNDSVLSK